ncbi:hypothetical protein C900_03490 [Fulvivirga imtechensis AK7]|uniref:Uncharacterized protein n=1 Tax=Fulvivirga imtechensis AK7 TaxID=1237149 RepID=L8JTU4_9BACT|nr:hypothetical protein C900_03490 [Fulvivirga imtechensis AK7]
MGCLVDNVAIDIVFFLLNVFLHHNVNLVGLKKSVGISFILEN